MHRNASEWNFFLFSYANVADVVVVVLLVILDHPHNEHRMVLNLYVHEFLLSPLLLF